MERNAILIAEDVVHQTYYLGRVDYWLLQLSHSQRFSYLKDGKLFDVYTSSEIIGTGADLELVLEASGGRDVYIIGSGENFEAGMRTLRSADIQHVLLSEQLEVVYVGRDGNTQVWKLKGSWLVN